MTRLVAVLALLVTTTLMSACAATAEPPTPTPSETSSPSSSGKFPDMSSYTPVNPEDYAQQLDNPGRPEKRTDYFFTTPDGVHCGFDQQYPTAACNGNNLPGIPPATCDEAQHVFQQNQISTIRPAQKTALSSLRQCSVSGPPGKTLPPFHTLTVYGVTCGVDDARTTACKDPQGRGFILSPSWSGWLPHV